MNHPGERRQWLAAMGRYLIAAGLFALTGGLAARWWRNRCPQPLSTCRACGLLARCGLPRARPWQEPNRG